MMCMPMLAMTVSAQTTIDPPARRTTLRFPRFEYKYTDKDFESTPAWNPEQSDPPLAIGGALEAARANLGRFVEKSAVWKVRSITLDTIGNDRWYYRVSFACSGSECRNLETRMFMMIVKMDGTIIEPKKLIAVDP